MSRGDFIASRVLCSFLRVVSIIRTTRERNEKREKSIFFFTIELCARIGASCGGRRAGK